ncbi:MULTISPECIES: hypothetical protein [unclassified Arthrobacter]|uniref:hypothetical protein n=1 Tax=unclassified Arthrobacter TaxID=235627 RepID=UPI001E5FF208|nr:MULTISPECIES: hypothetical protein [unclassified Arthrobacter]MCC9146050.1 hypothetical protein [Arthrobacter sp. zg-Y919]MDK1277279.1 hypothetical protein [Arthrobacter sp. zg.Y919]MDM7990584.1 hypothetical protein [Arthrobacter sp. zg-Y877]WIB03790.1 hypothetical protein QNO10_03670 [Arthrobacter sp. zg-Y919]
MQSIRNGKTPSSPSTPGHGISRRMGSTGIVVMLIVFLVAVVFAANQNDVIGWLVVIVSLGWLFLATFVVFSVRSATRKATAKIAEATADLAPRAGVQVLDEDTVVRDRKLDHSFKIIEVQAKVIADNLDTDRGMVDRALDTIGITAHNGRGMIKKDDGGTVEGTVVD